MLEAKRQGELLMADQLKIADDPWYKKGLKFKCTGCGNCCTGSPGHVWVDREEIEILAEFLKISPEDFVKKYTRHVHGRLSLLEHSKTFDCVFLKDKKCTLYHARPRQCRTFPWWPENLKSPKSWKEAAKGCEGIEHPDAPVISLEEIKQNLKLEEK